MMHLLLVAGPSAGGKSEFIRALVGGRLPAEICDRLPPGCESWPLLEANDLLKRGADAAPSPLDYSQPLIAHYDIVHVPRVQLAGGYAADPFAALLAAAEHVTLVDVCPPPARLLAQFRHRLGAQRRAKGRLRVLWSRLVHAPLRRAVRTPGEAPLVKADLYEDPHWVEACYRGWDAFVRDALGDRLEDTLRVLPLAPPGRDPPQFRLAP